jgi:hypothetical protein
MYFVVELLGAILEFILELSPAHGRSWLDEEVNPRRDEGSRGLL